MGVNKPCDVPASAQVLLLASADAALRRDQQLASPAVRFRATAEAAAAAARELHFVEFEVSHGLL